MSSIPFTLRQLEYFDAIAAEGSLAAAAQRCRVSASALALALDELERHLSLQLFVRRKGRGVTLTVAGARVLALSREVVTGAESLAADAWQESGSLTGRLGIGCFSTLAPFFLPSIVQDFQRDHPGLELDLLEASAPGLHELLLQGRVDVALLYSVDVSSQVVFDPVHEYRPHILVAATHPLARGGAIRLSQLADEPLISLDVQPTRQNTEHIFGELGIPMRIGHTTSSFELARCLVGRELGYAVMFQRSESAGTYDGNEVVALEILDPVRPTVVGLARPVAAPRAARYRALHDFLVARAPVG